MNFKKIKQKLKFKNDKIASVLIGNFSTSLAVVIVLVGGIVFVSGCTAMLNATAQQVNAISSGISKKIGTYYESTEVALKVLGKDSNLQAAITDLNKHGAKILGNASDVNSIAVKNIQKKLADIVKEDPAIFGAYLATSKNQLLTNSNTPFKEDFNVTERDWYKKVVANGELTWADPYNDIATGGQCITVGLPIKNAKGGVTAVLAFDIDLSKLAQDLEGDNIGETGFNALAVKEGENFKFLYSTKNEHQETLVNKTLVPEVTDPETETAISGLIEILNEATTDDNAPLRYPTVNMDGVKEMHISARKDDAIGLYKIIGLNHDEYFAAPNALFVRTLIVGTVVGSIVMYIVFRKLQKIGKDLEYINETVSKLKEGDLTVEIEGDILDIKHESGQLASNLNDTVSTLRSLMSNIDGASKSLGSSAEEVSASATETNARIEEIATTMNDIVEGISEQAATAEDSNSAVIKLAERLENLKDASSSISVLTEDVRKENQQGLLSVNDLKYYTEENNKSSQAVAGNINELSKKAETIETIVDTMSTIADQTNILALNASIEAARAGEMGAGFSVVAGEVKKLAEQSARHAESIREIITAIQKDIEKSVKDVDNAISIAEKQSNAVETVVDAFGTISSSTESITESITDINEFVNTLNNDKDVIVENIEKIARVSQRSAASSEEISASIQEQTALTSTLATTASKLTDLSSDLSDDIKKFDL